ncbi:MAG: hypothetical protein ACRESZ_11320 [Methylococcales bacterium]
MIKTIHNRLPRAGRPALRLAGALTLALAAGPAFADSLVVDSNAGTGALFRVDPAGGNRTLLSDFGDAGRGRSA